MGQDLVGVAEVAEMLGVSRQRVNQLVQGDPDFPEPEAVLAAGRIWLRSAIDEWSAVHPRTTTRQKPGQGVGSAKQNERPHRRRS